ncbi:MAG: type I glutamate--ammonia ligase [Desulfohalobiaceae bacterium]
MQEPLVFDCKTPDDVIKAVKEHRIKFIQFWFLDVVGTLKNFQVMPDELPEAFSEGMGFDGSSIEGFSRIHESDMVAFPDPTTFQLITWEGNDYSVARMFCDIKTPEGEPYEGDSRYVLKRILDRAAQKGLTNYVGPELEFFLFSDSKQPKTLDVGGYFDAPPLDLANNIRRDIILALNNMGINVEYSHHEVAPSQHEIDLRYQEALKMADISVTYRVIVKEVARQHGVYATFMPKPLFGENGSGMHVHQSLFQGNKNIFYDHDDPQGLSQEAKHFIAGVLKHAREYTAVTNQWVNSYKRLVPGFEAPVYIAWARRNRSALVRVPMYKPGKEQATRVELRSPDPACNPYLAFAVTLAAGLEGMEKQYELPAPVESDIYDMQYEERLHHGIDTLPGSLYEALDEMSRSRMLQEALGSHIFEKFIQNKRLEWHNYRIQVTDYEIQKYLPLL